MSGNSILLVEDDRDIGTLLADFLVREAFAVEVAQDGAAVDRAFARAKPWLRPRPTPCVLLQPLQLMFGGDNRQLGESS
jgi:DNA-binding response OmpR family regulator